MDCTAVLGTQLHGRGIARDILAPVTCHMVVHPFLQGLQQRRLAMVSAAHDKRHAAPDAHASRGAMMRKVEHDILLARGLERQGAAHGP